MNIKTQLIGLKAILKKDIKRNFRIWRQNLLPPVISAMLYFVVFGHVMGNRIGTMEGYPYVEFIAAGLIMMQLITNAYVNSAMQIYISKFNRSVQEVLVSPLSPLFILLGWVGGGVFRGLMVGFVVSLIAMVFVHLTIFSWLTLLLMALLASTLFATAGVINAIYAKNFEQINIIPTFVLTPLTYLGGVFYSIKLLPPFWQKLSLFNPILYIVNAFRYGFLGISDSSLKVAFLTTMMITIILMVIAYILIKKGYGLTE